MEIVGNTIKSSAAKECSEIVLSGGCQLSVSPRTFVMLILMMALHNTPFRVQYVYCIPTANSSMKVPFPVLLPPVRSPTNSILLLSLQRGPCTAFSTQRNNSGKGEYDPAQSSDIN
ncbi:hypothetical protein PM082_024333 [Marasmius tenuissimus]|nr:hypothetical protein PM082_024333 [Marasmius tenuissimus]